MEEILFNALRWFGLKDVVFWHLLKVHFAQVFIGVYSDVALCKGFFFLLDGVFFNVLSFVLG